MCVCVRGRGVCVGMCVCVTGRAGTSLVHLALFGEREIGFCPGGLVGGAFELRWRWGVLELPVAGWGTGQPPWGAGWGWGSGEPGRADPAPGI